MEFVKLIVQSMVESKVDSMVDLIVESIYGLEGLPQTKQLSEVLRVDPFWECYCVRLPAAVLSGQNRMV